MVRRGVVLAAAAAFLLGSCGRDSLTLPEGPIDRAATCAVVAAIEARAATTDLKAPLSFEAQHRILHYSLLAGAEAESFSLDAANAVTRRMSELQKDITVGKWQDLSAPCREAFPIAENAEPKLPSGRFDAQLQCDELGDFISTALQSQDVHYAAELNDYGGMARKLDRQLGPGLRARAGTDLGSQREERRKALAAAAKLGPPSTVMKQCVERFG